MLLLYILNLKILIDLRYIYTFEKTQRYHILMFLRPSVVHLSKLWPNHGLYLYLLDKASLTLIDFKCQILYIERDFHRVMAYLQKRKGKN